MNTPGTDEAQLSPRGTAPPPTLIAISLKLYFDVPRTRTWCEQVAALASTHPVVTTGATELVVLPSLPSLPVATAALAGSAVRLGAQDLFHEDRGAFTGATSGADLRGVGCTYVEVGHFERRTLFGENDQVVALKTQAAWRNQLTPILCIGESSNGSVDESVSYCVHKLQSALATHLDSDLDTGLDPPARGLVLAYEPSWAIGAEEPAAPEHVVAVVREVRAWLADHRFSIPTRIIYGGSAGVGLLTDLGTAVDGLFLGRFAHDTSALSKILDETVHEPA